VGDNAAINFGRFLSILGGIITYLNVIFWITCCFVSYPLGAYRLMAIYSSYNTIAMIPISLLLMVGWAMDTSTFFFGNSNSSIDQVTINGKVIFTVIPAAILYALIGFGLLYDGYHSQMIVPPMSGERNKIDTAVSPPPPSPTSGSSMVVRGKNNREYSTQAQGTKLSGNNQKGDHHDQPNGISEDAASSAISHWDACGIQFCGLTGIERS
jgi:hypothetical protein